MIARRALPAALVVLALLAAPLAAAQALSPPADAFRVAVGGYELAHWVGAEPSDDAEAPGASMSAQVNESATLWFALRPAVNATMPAANRTAYVNVTSDALGLAEALVVEHPAGAAWAFANVTFVPTTASENATYTFTVELHEEQENGTVLLASATDTGSVYVLAAEVPAPPEEPVLPFPALVALLVGLLGVVVLGGVAARRRAERRRMNRAPRRSQVLREVELERQLERAAEKDPEQAAVIKQEIRQQEQVREKRRELQILEAKRADALKTIDLLRKRHEAGGLTKLQFDNMVAKKQADLARIEAEIAQMEAEDARGGSAAA